MTLNEWEQSNIEVLTSREMGEWLGRRENRLLDQIRAEIEQNAYPIVHGVNNHEKGMTLYGILQIIDKYRGVIE